MKKIKKIKAILKSLQEDGKKVTLCGYVKKKKSESPTFDHSCMIDLSHINFFKEPDKNFIRKLLSNSFDAVIDLTLSPILPLQYVLAYSNAPFKAGRKNEILNLLDFMINIKSTEPEEENKRLTIPGIDEDYLYRQIIFYLKNIESNN